MSENNSILLPANLSHVTKCCADMRYVLAAVHVVATEDGYRVEATDAKRLARVDGTNAGDPAKFPEIPALTTAPNGASEALIPAKVFAKACKDVNTRLAGPEERRALAVRLGKEVSTLATIDEDGGSLVRQPRNVEGRFPNTDAILPTSPWLASWWMLLYWRSYFRWPHSLQIRVMSPLTFSPKVRLGSQARTPARSSRV
jgi:hypothetical protein